MAIKDTFGSNRAFYARVIGSLVLFVLFVIFSVSALLTASMQDWPWLLSGLLIGSVLILPRSARRARRSDGEQSAEHAEYWRRVEKWLTGLRLAYLVIAVFLWLALPRLVG